MSVEEEQHRRRKQREEWIADAVSFEGAANGSVSSDARTKALTIANNLRLKALCSIWIPPTPEEE